MTYTKWYSTLVTVASLLALILNFTTASAQEVTVPETFSVRWNYPYPTDNVTGFNIYANDIVVSTVPVSSRSTELTLTPGLHVIFATAFNATLESPPSNTLTVDVGAAITDLPAPVNLGIINNLFSFYSSDPVTDDITDNVAYELGHAFIARVDGTAEALRFWRSPSEPGAHIGRLCTLSGVELATVTFLNSDTTGWHEMPLGVPVALVAGEIYVVSTNVESHFPYDTMPTPLDTDPLEFLGGAIGYEPGTCIIGAVLNTSAYYKDIVFTY